MNPAKYTIKDFRTDFPNDDVCLEYIFAKRFSERACPKCKRVGHYSRITGRKQYACICGHHVAPTAGTIFHKSSTPLTLWFHAIYLFSQSKNGVSAKELERQLGVTYKCAWRMAHEIRKLMEQSPKRTGGVFELDETYIGGRGHGVVGRGSKTKTPVFGIAKRKGGIVTEAVGNVARTTIMPIIHENIRKGSTICTDEYHIYKRAFPDMNHKRVNHGSGEYAHGIAHTNNLEGYWSQLKRSIKGTYVHVSRKHLQGYLNEFSYRYNHRASSLPIFDLMLEQAAQ